MFVSEPKDGAISSPSAFPIVDSQFGRNPLSAAATRDPGRNTAEARSRLARLPPPPALPEARSPRAKVEHLTTTLRDLQAPRAPAAVVLSQSIVAVVVGRQRRGH